jgi:DNA-binding MarR family transcriptional regulator
MNDDRDREEAISETASHQDTGIHRLSEGSIGHDTMSDALLEDIVSIEYESLILGRRITTIAGFRDPQIGILDRSAYILLVNLEHDALSIGELSEATGLDASTLNRQTAAMRRNGIIERIPDPQGGMARKFRISQKGKNSLSRQRHRNLGALSTVLSDWSDKDISDFATALTRFNQSIQQRVIVKGGKFSASHDN